MVHPGDVHFSQDQCQPYILVMQWSEWAGRALIQQKQAFHQLRSSCPNSSAATMSVLWTLLPPLLLANGFWTGRVPWYLHSGHAHARSSGAAKLKDVWFEFEKYSSPPLSTVHADLNCVKVSSQPLTLLRLTNVGYKPQSCQAGGYGHFMTI